MALFNWHISSYQKGGATSQSNYIWRREDFIGPDDLVASGSGNLPHWCNNDPAIFFHAADLFERKNGSACRHLVISLPRELGLQEWIDLVGMLINHDIGKKPYQWAIHRASKDGSDHPHVHIVYSDRVPDELDRPAETFFARFNPASPTLGGCKKDSGGQSPKQLRISVIRRKKLWADLQNEALKAAGHAACVDPRLGDSTVSK